MAENTKIEWCDHTFNPWEGCQKVGPGCDNCYAETRNARFAGGAAINWGPGAPRRRECLHQISEPAPAGEYPALPEPDATTVGLGAVWNRHSMRAYVDAARALWAQAAPQQEAQELKVMRAIASCRGDAESIQQAEIDLHRLQHIESAALLALGMLWMTERHSPNAQAAFQTLRNALGGQDALRRGIEAAIDAGLEADHPPGAGWWAGKKEGKQ